MSRSPKRSRGVVLTQQGIDRLEVAIAMAQDKEKYGKRFTQAELSERANLSIKTIKKIRDRIAPVDEVSVRTLFEAFGLALETADYGLPELTSQLAEHKPTPKEKRSTKIDWGEKPDTAIFFGRTEELTTLNRWVMDEQCRLVTLLGMGGIGKTSLTAKLADQIYDQFDYVIWRSLREAPPLDEILVRLIQFLSDQHETEINLPTRLGERIIRLLHYLREYRCLLILDNLESILKAESPGQFRDGYEGYGELIHQVGGAEHQSCLLLTSRECPRELAPMAGDQLPVRLWPVRGIDSEAGQKILKAKGLDLNEADAQGQELLRRYSGNPQALHLVATAIQREFLGDVDDFLEEEGTAVEDVRSLLNQHLSRLLPLERSLLFWLAINREPVGLEELMEDLLSPLKKREVRNALRGLRDRYLIEIVGKQFTLQNVIMEFATDRFVEMVSKELENQKFDLLHEHALIKATAKDYVRETQVRLILRPAVMPGNNLDWQVNKSLQEIRQNLKWANGYAPGNLLNILCQMQSKVCNADFSSVSLRQVYLKGMILHDLKINNTIFIRPSLTQPFSRIHTVVFSPDGKLLVTGDGVGDIQVWRVRDRQLLSTFEGHTNEVRGMAFSPDGKLLVTGSTDNTIRLWDVKQQKCISIFREHTHHIWSVAFSPNGNFFASGSGDNTIRLWNIKQQKCISIFREHTHYVWSVAFSPHGRFLASGSSDNTVRLWDIKQQKCIYVFEGHTDWVRSVAFSSDGQTLASGSSDSTVRVWDIQQRKCLDTFTDHTSWVRSVAFSPDGDFLASGSGDSTIRLWDIQQRKCLHAFVGHENWLRSIAFSPDSNFLASGSEDSTIRLWDIQQRKCLHVFAGHTNRVGPVVFSPNGQLLASAGGDSMIRLWDIQQQRCLHILEENSNWLESLIFSPDGKFLYSSSAELTVRQWNLENYQSKYMLQGYIDRIKMLAFGADNEVLGSLSSESLIQVWNVKQQRCLHILEGDFNRLSTSAFSLDCRFLACSSFDRKIWLWDLQNQRCLHTFEGHTSDIKTLVFSPTSQFIASSSADSTIRIWDIQSLQFLCTLKGHTNWVNHIVFSQDGDFLVSGSGDHTVRLWDIQKRQCIHIFEGHTDWIRSVSFHPNGKTIASGSKDGTIRLWNSQTGSCLATLQVPRPYEGTDITDVQGLNEAQRTAMLTLGAIVHSSDG